MHSYHLLLCNEYIYRGLRSWNVWITEESRIVLSGFEYTTTPHMEDVGDERWRYITGDEPYVGPDQLKKSDVSHSTIIKMSCSISMIWFVWGYKRKRYLCFGVYFSFHSILSSVLFDLKWGYWYGRCSNRRICRVNQIVLSILGSTACCFRSRFEHRRTCKQ